MFETRNAAAETQQEFWIDARRLPKATASTFYRKLDETLDSIGFAQGVREICRPAYAELSRGGRPGIDPAVYFKMLMIGFFENLPSERSIASRCADSFSLRAFLGYGLEEATPDHSSLSVIRGRLGTAIYQAAFELVLQGLRQHGLLKGRNLGIDSSVIEANASLRALVHRNTEEEYWEYVKRLAAEAGIDPDDTKAVRRFDKNREGRKTSNQEWVNPHDPDAKVGMTKHGACDMIYKPEHITDLDTGVIVAAEVRCGDEGDTVGLAERVLAAGEVLARVCEDPGQTKVLTSLTADEGYFAVEETCCLQLERVRVIIGDPHESKRKPDKQEAVVRQVLHKAKQAVGSKSGKALLRKRGEHLERSFCHVLDHGKHRRATLRGRKNLTKRQLAAAFTHNLSVLMRHLTGHGTPKQWLAAAAGAFFGVLAASWAAVERLLAVSTRKLQRYRFNRLGIVGTVRREPWRQSVTWESGIRRFSTGC
jgi:transposase